MSLSEAVRSLIRPGMSLHLAYGGARPNAAVAEVIRQFHGGSPAFTISAQGFVSTQHALVGSGLVDKLVVAFAGENYPSPRPNPVLQRAVASGSVSVENWSIWALTARLMAGALGIDWFPVRSLRDSSMAEEHRGRDYLEIDTGRGRTLSLVSALRPDVVLIHALAADSEGNVLLAPPYGEGAWGALAARAGTIACVETVVDAQFIRDHNTWPMIPAHAVSAVCHVPRGSHPYGIYTAGLSGVAGYGEDPAFMTQLRRAARDPVSMRAWIDEWMLQVADHAEMLARWERSRFNLPGPQAPRGPDVGPTGQERMVLAAARVLRERVRQAGHDVVLAGIGFAHLAAWTAVARLRAAGQPVQLAAELGMFGLTPQPGDPYLFALQNLPTCRQLTDVLTVLGRDMNGPATSSIAILGAGQIDAVGNLNSTYGSGGEFLLGSGGANDAASGADDVIAVIGHSAMRLVTAVNYVTAPGRRVSVIVTSAGVLERRDGRYVLTSYFEQPGRSRTEIIADIRANTGWALEVAADADAEPDVDAAELSLLRSYDPTGIFVGRTHKRTG